MKKRSYRDWNKLCVCTTNSECKEQKTKSGQRSLWLTFFWYFAFQLVRLFLENYVPATSVCGVFFLFILPSTTKIDRLFSSTLLDLSSTKTNCSLFKHRLFGSTGKNGSSNKCMCSEFGVIWVSISVSERVCACVLA